MQLGFLHFRSGNPLAFKRCGQVKIRLKNTCAISRDKNRMVRRFSFSHSRTEPLSTNHESSKMGFTLAACPSFSHALAKSLLSHFLHSIIVSMFEPIIRSAACALNWWVHDISSPNALLHSKANGCNVDESTLIWASKRGHYLVVKRLLACMPPSCTTEASIDLCKFIQGHASLLLGQTKDTPDQTVAEFILHHSFSFGTTSHAWLKRSDSPRNVTRSCKEPNSFKKR
eukprot:1137662-Pelagomonas_calceolata.AAC.13